MHVPADFFSLLLDCLDDQIAVLDAAGRIAYVNRAWVRFGRENGQPADCDWIGTDYLAVCQASATAAGGDADAAKAHAGIRRVLAGEADSFYHEYPCHSPEVRRWFLMRIVPLRGAAARFCVVSHVNITERKLAEEAIEAQALSDQLTGLANRRHFDRFLHQEWQRSLRDRTPISLVLLDLDHFKHYNDSLGHVAGDAYLRGVGRVLGRHMRRPTDLAARYGGEEFALILGSTDQRGALHAAESVRTGIAALRDELACGPLVTSASAGVACTVPASSGDAGLLVELADAALYRAKQSGRDRVVGNP